MFADDISAVSDFKKLNNSHDDWGLLKLKPIVEIKDRKRTKLLEEICLIRSLSSTLWVQFKKVTVISVLLKSWSTHISDHVIIWNLSVFILKFLLLTFVWSRFTQTI